MTNEWLIVNITVVLISFGENVIEVPRFIDWGSLEEGRLLGNEWIKDTTKWLPRQPLRYWSLRKQQNEMSRRLKRDYRRGINAPSVTVIWCRPLVGWILIIGPMISGAFVIYRGQIYESATQSWPHFFLGDEGRCYQSRAVWSFVLVVRMGSVSRTFFLLSQAKMHMMTTHRARQCLHSTGSGWKWGGGGGDLAGGWFISVPAGGM